MIQERYCSYELSKLLKEKGFNDEVRTYYQFDNETKDAELIHDDRLDTPNLWSGDYYSAPTHQMAMDWLMETHNVYICPKYCCFCGSRKNDMPYFKWEARILKLPSSNIIYPHPLDMCEHYETYEDAVEAALKYCLTELI